MTRQMMERASLMVVTLLIGVAAVAVAAWGWPVSLPGASRAAHAPLAHAGGATAVPMIGIETVIEMPPSDPPRLVQAAPTIVRGVVGKPYPSRWDTPSGRLPPGTTAQNIGFDRRIYTDYPVTVERVHRGAVTERTIRVRTIGGKVGRDTYTTNIAVRLAPGQRVLLLLARGEHPETRGIGPAHYYLRGEIRSVYEVDGLFALNRDYNESNGETGERKVAVGRLETLICDNPYRASRP